MLQYCHKGPERAEVEDVEIEYEEPADYNTFKIRY
jgi:acylphosphatase